MGIIENISTCSLYQYVVLFNAIFLSGGGVSKREKKISFFFLKEPPSQLKTFLFEKRKLSF